MATNKRVIESPTLLRGPRMIARAGVLAAVGMFALAGFSGPAQATQRASMNAVQGTTTTAEFPPLLGSAPTSGAVDLDPETCARPESAFCDTVPIDVTTAGKLNIEVGWADLDGTGTDDIDIILYDAGRAGQYSKLGASESSKRPEEINATVGKGRVNLVVVHWGGVNNGYSVSTRVLDPPTLASGTPAASSVTAPASPDEEASPPSAGSGSRFTGSFAKSAPIAATIEQELIEGFDPNSGTPPVDETSAAPKGLSAEQVSSAAKDAGGDIGWLAWVMAALFPLLLGAVVLNSRRTNNAPVI